MLLRRPAVLRNLPPDSPLHWANVYVAREHRSNDLKETGRWGCGCWTCRGVREALFHEVGAKDFHRLIQGGAK